MSEPQARTFNVDRLRWQCRRGMLELDYLLLEFLEQQFESLPEAMKADFVRLLEAPDQDLQRWLVGGQAVPEPGLNALVRYLLDHRRS